MKDRKVCLIYTLVISVPGLNSLTPEMPYVVEEGEGAKSLQS